MLISKNRHDMESIDESLEIPKKVMKQVSTNNGFSSRILDGAYAKKLSESQYFELTDDICVLLNTSWLSNPNLKNFATMVMAGAVMCNTDTGNTLLISTVEVYGRTPFVDPHYETPLMSFPPKFAKYKNVWPTTLKMSDGGKVGHWNPGTKLPCHGKYQGGFRRCSRG